MTEVVPTSRSQAASGWRNVASNPIILPECLPVPNCDLSARRLWRPLSYLGISLGSSASCSGGLLLRTNSVLQLYYLGDERVRDERLARVFRAQPGRIPYTLTLRF